MASDNDEVIENYDVGEAGGDSEINPKKKIKVATGETIKVRKPSIKERLSSFGTSAKEKAVDLREKLDQWQEKRDEINLKRAEYGARIAAAKSQVEGYKSQLMENEYTQHGLKALRGFQKKRSISGEILGTNRAPISFGNSGGHNPMGIFSTGSHRGGSFRIGGTIKSPFSLGVSAPRTGGRRSSGGGISLFGSSGRRGGGLQLPSIGGRKGKKGFGFKL